MTAPDNKTMRTLAAIGERTNYADLVATGIDIKLLMTNVANLKRRGFVVRLNAGASTHETAVFAITEAGRAHLRGDRLELPKPETSVELALKARPALATVWGRA